MPNDENSRRRHAQDGEDRNFRSLFLLALPWLSFQRDILALMKRGIEDASHVRPIENLSSRELQALMMIFDPSGRFRNLLDPRLPEQIKETYTKIFPKLVSGSLLLIDTQDEILASLADLVDKLRKETKPRGGTERGTSKRSE